MKGIFCLFAGLMWASSAVAQSLPNYDTHSYCRTVSDAIGGSYQIELTCREQEEAAARQVRSESVPDRVMGYCDQVSRAIGGSYQILETCIQQELLAKSQLD